MSRLAIAALLCGLFGSSQALPITYNVQLFDNNQVLQGEGSFTLDNVAADPTILQEYAAGGLQDFDVLAFDFTVAGTVFDLASLNLLNLIADAAGKVTDYMFVAFNSATDSLIVLDAPAIQTHLWELQIADSQRGLSGEGAASVVTVPEPSSVALLGLGLLGVIRRGRGKRRLGD